MHYLELIKLHKKFCICYFKFCFSRCRRNNTSSSQVKMRLISQLINGILRVLQKLRKYFNCTAISTSSVLPSTKAFSVILIFYFNVHFCNIATNIPKVLNNYRYIQLNYALALQHPYILLYLFKVLFISLMQSVNGEQFLNITALFLSSNLLAAYNFLLQ